MKKQKDVDYTTWDAIITGDTKESAMKKAREMIRKDGGLCKR